MQLEGFFLFLFMAVLFPIFILLSNHDVFFVIVATVLFFVSLKKIHYAFFNIKAYLPEPDDDISGDLEYSINLDVKKFETGIVVIKDLIYVLFFVYCSFFFADFWIKSVIVCVSLYWIHDIISVIHKDRLMPDSKPKRLFVLFLNIFTLILIVLTTISKYSAIPL